MHKVTLTVFLYLMHFGVIAQTPSMQEILTKVVENYQHPGGVSMSFTLTQGSIDVLDEREQTKGMIAQQGDKKYYKVDSMEYVTDGTYEVIVDHEEKLIVLDSVFSNQQVEKFSFDKMKPDSMLKFFSIGKLVVLPNGDYQISETGKGIIEHSELVIDSKSMFIKSIKIF